MKKSILKNKKGFTLVELLAVIVVLAIIILIAMPSVMSAMDKARKNALVTEVSEISKIAQTAYADKSMDGSGVTDMCFGLHYLVDNGYLDKKLDNYSGDVHVSVVNGVVTTEITISNGIYSYIGASKDVTNEKLKSGSDGAAVKSDCSNYASATAYTTAQDK